MLQSPRIGSIHEMEEALSFSRGLCSIDSSLGLGGSAEEWPTKLKGGFFRHGSKRVRDRIRTSYTSSAVRGEGSLPSAFIPE